MKDFISYRLPIILYSLIGLVFIFELIRDSGRAGDFMGYVNAGNAVLQGTPIYADFFNTWPPFFSVFSVPLALVHNVSPRLIRVIWLLGIGLAWVGIVRISVKLFLQRSLVIKLNRETDIEWTSWLVLLPLILVFRFIMDDLSNIQINTYLLLSSLFILIELENGRLYVAAMVMALIISLKVYPIFLLFFLVWKRRYRFALFSIAGIIVINICTALVFGYDGAMDNYVDWVQNKLSGPINIHHKNQSVFGFFAGLFSNVSRGLNIQYNLLDIGAESAKKLTLLIILIAAIYPAWLTRKSYATTSPLSRRWEYAILLAAIPLLSPLAWKYYFVFTFPLLLLAIWQFQYPLGAWIKWLFGVVVVLTILTTDGLVGNRLSDVFEVFGCITFGTTLLIAIGLYFLKIQHLELAQK